MVNCKQPSQGGRASGRQQSVLQHMRTGSSRPRTGSSHRFAQTPGESSGGQLQLEASGERERRSRSVSSCEPPGISGRVALSSEHSHANQAPLRLPSRFHCRTCRRRPPGMLVPTLQRLAVATLIRFRDALGDIGYVPVELLQDVLAACSPQQLAAIEDETLAGTGRTLKPWTWPLWREHWQKQFASSFGTPAPGALPPLPPAAEVAQGEPGVRPADYRCAFPFGGTWEAPGCKGEDACTDDCTTVRRRYPLLCAPRIGVTPHLQARLASSPDYVCPRLHLHPPPSSQGALRAVPGRARAEASRERGSAAGAARAGAAGAAGAAHTGCGPWHCARPPAAAAAAAWAR